MILEIDKEFAIDLSAVESIERVSDKTITICMKSGKTYRLSYFYETIVKMWKQQAGEFKGLLKNIDNNTQLTKI